MNHSKQLVMNNVKKVAGLFYLLYGVKTA
uniref:Uncharacterized protein n=1 Tax=Arundo donax TaxID=35708 RepID=A0A0A9AH05_ARUDO